MQNIETLRTLATFLLIAYHVIGISVTGGMRVPDESAWRFLSDLLVDVRMPMFAFIAGAVYALRPLSIEKIAQFMDGKFHRLVVPGVIASSVFWILGNTIFGQAYSTGEPILKSLLLANGHFWFLQSILLIFLVFGTIDAVLKYNATLALLAASVLLSLGWGYWGGPRYGYLQLYEAIFLLPYFVIGVFFIRNTARVSENRTSLILMAVCLVLFGLFQNIGVYLETNRLSTDRLDLQSLTFGTGVILLLYILFPPVSWMSKIGVFTFTIYLYHPIGTSLVRRVFSKFDWDPGLLQFATGMAVGTILPIMFHIVASQTAVSSRVFLGVRKKTTEQKPSRFAEQS